MPADVRFIAATNQDLEKRVGAGQFRKDLFYRLQFAHLHLPPLRERIGDVPLLAAHFLRTSAFAKVRLDEDALAVLERHDWPGNVRELRGVLEAASNLAENGVIEPAHLKVRPQAAVPRPRAPAGSPETLEQVERRHILAVYEALGRNKTHAARALDIGLHTLQRKLKACGVE